MIKSLPSSILSIAAVLLLAVAASAAPPATGTKTAAPAADAVVERPTKSGSVQGTITDTKGHPIAGARVASLGRVQDPDSVASTDAHGHYRLDDMRTGSNRLAIVVSAKGFAPRFLIVEQGSAEHPATVDAKLEPGHSIHGRLVDENGKPAAGATIFARDRGIPVRIARDNRNSQTTDADGRFSFDSLSSDVRFQISVSNGLEFLNIKLPLDHAEPVVYTVASAGMIRGKVVDAETGKPVGAFRVRMAFGLGQQVGNPANGFALSRNWNQRGQQINSTDGRFKIEPLASQRTYTVTIDADGYEPNTVPSALAQHADQASELNVVLLPVHPADYSALRGQLLDYRGKGIAGAQLRLISSSQPLDTSSAILLQRLASNPDRVVDRVTLPAFVNKYLSATTDASGNFEFTKIVPNQFLGLIYWGQHVPNGFWTASEKTHPGKDLSIILRVPQPAVIRGTIDRKQLAGIKEVDVDRDDPFSFDHQEVRLDKNESTFEFQNLARGDYSVSIYGPPINGPARRIQTPIATKQLTIGPGEGGNVQFTEPDKK